MSALTDQFDDDLVGVIADLPTTIAGTTPAGASFAFNAVFTDLTKGDSNQIGGFVPDYEATVHAAASTLPTTRPNVGWNFTILGKTYVVDQVIISPDLVEYRFLLRSLSR